MEKVENHQSRLHTSRRNIKICKQVLIRLTLPMAKSPLSKKRITPRKIKVTPKAANPTPISEIKKKYIF